LFANYIFLAYHPPPHVLYYSLPDDQSTFSIHHVPSIRPLQHPNSHLCPSEATGDETEGADCHGMARAAISVRLLFALSMIIDYWALSFSRFGTWIYGKSSNLIQVLRTWRGQARCWTFAPGRSSQATRTGHALSLATPTRRLSLPGFRDHDADMLREGRADVYPTTRLARMGTLMDSCSLFRRLRVSGHEHAVFPSFDRRPATLPAETVTKLRAAA
jgi:hypothetical protein